MPGAPAPAARKPFVSAILLAAGSSTRFGSPKLLAEVGGEPMLARVVRAFCSAGVDQTLVVIPPEDTGSLHRSLRQLVEHSPPSVRWRVNLTPAAGMFSSVKAGLSSLDERTTWIAVSPADLPFLRDESVRKVLDGTATLDERSLLVPAHAGRRGHPLVFSRGLVTRLLAWGDGRRLSDLFDEPDLRVVPLGGFGNDVLRDVDAPTDLAAAGA